MEEFMSNEVLEYVFKISVIGSYASGKTSLINKFVDRSFSQDYKPTLGASIIAKDVETTHKESKILARLVLWDIAGQEKYDAVRAMYFQGCIGGIFVYDITRPPTFEDIKAKWHRDFKAYAMKNAVFVLIGNKVDLEEMRKVSTEEGIALAKEIGAVAFIETSAKTGKNVEEMFQNITNAILDLSH